MICNTYSKTPPVFTFICPKVMLLRRSQSKSNGILSNQSENKCVDLSVEINVYSSSDFSLGNIIAADALGTLKQVYTSSLSDMNIADKFENLNFETK